MIDIEHHEPKLRKSLKNRLAQIRAMLEGGLKPETIWLSRSDMCCLVADVGSHGVDVSGVFAFRGIAVMGAPD